MEFYNLLIFLENRHQIKNWIFKKRSSKLICNKEEGIFTTGAWFKEEQRERQSTVSNFYFIMH